MRNPFKKKKKIDYRDMISNIQCDDARAVASMLRDRAEEGMAKFGKTMKENDKPIKKWIEDAQQEAIDFAIYLERIKSKLK